MRFAEMNYGKGSSGGKPASGIILEFKPLANEFLPLFTSCRFTRSPRILQKSLQAGHEGLMAKGLDSAYAAGQRGFYWLKVKRARALDLVILAAEWGHGRRRGWLSNILLTHSFFQQAK
jgi:DNA ligase-1